MMKRHYLIINISPIYLWILLAIWMSVVTVNPIHATALVNCQAVNNGDFESGTSGWWNISTTTDAYSGNQAGYKNAAGNFATQTAHGSITAGRTYTLTFWAKKEGGRSAIIGIDWQDGNGQEISDISVDGIVANNWTAFTLTGVAPSGTSRINIWGYQSGGQLKIDDFCLTMGNNSGGSSNDNSDTDYGDAPASYGSICYGINRSSTITRFGDLVDGESNASYSDNATGDNGDDGFSFGNSMNWERGTTQTLTFSWQTNDGSGHVYGWIDWNQDGVFADPAERIIANFQVGYANGVSDNYGGQRQPNGTKTISVSVPATAKCGATFARFTIQSDENEFGPTGNFCNENIATDDGEVEDYQIQITGCMPPVGDCTIEINQVILSDCILNCYTATVEIEYENVFSNIKINDCTFSTSSPTGTETFLLRELSCMATNNSIITVEVIGEENCSTQVSRQPPCPKPRICR